MDPNRTKTATRPPAQVLIEFVDAIEEAERGGIDELYRRLIAADPATLKTALTGRRKSIVKSLIERDMSELSLDDYSRNPTPSALKVVVDHIIGLINQLDNDNKQPGGTGVDAVMVSIVDYVGDHPDEVKMITIDGQSLVVFLHSMAGSEECNNVLAGVVRPRLQSVSSGRPLVLLAWDKLKAAGVLR